MQVTCRSHGRSPGRSHAGHMQVTWQVAPLHLGWALSEALTGLGPAANWMIQLCPYIVCVCAMRVTRTFVHRAGDLYTSDLYVLCMRAVTSMCTVTSTCTVTSNCTVTSMCTVTSTCTDPYMH